MIMRMLRITFAASGRPEKLLMGPTAPRPGPMPAMQVATELEAVMGSTPVITTIIVPRTKRKGIIQRMTKLKYWYSR
jgi:hypothetical protein